MGDRMAILDTPDGMLPQEVLEWRMNLAGFVSKMAALYWPWIEVMDDLPRYPGSSRGDQPLRHGPRR